MYGLCLDALVEVEVVIASGDIVRANQTINSDLFWFRAANVCGNYTANVPQAVRGAGASFGVVTSFVFKTWPAPTDVTHYSFEYV